MEESDRDGNTQTTTVALRSVVENAAYTYRKIIATAAIVSLSVFLLGYVVVASGIFGSEYVQSSSVYIALIGIFYGLVVLLWAAKFHLQVWEDVRDCFAVSEQTYDETIDPGLNRIYSVKRISVKFLLALALTIIADLLIGIPYLIVVFKDGAPIFGRCLFFVAGTCADKLALVNYLYGLVVLGVVVATIHGIEHFFSLVFRVFDLPIADINTAADRLEPIVQFSVFASTASFGGVILVLIEYAVMYNLVFPWLKEQSDDPVTPLTFLVDNSLIVIITIAGLIIVSLLIFWIPQLVIHTALSEAKQQRLAAINDEYNKLLEMSRSESGSPDDLSEQLEIIEAQRRNAKEIRTWSYNIPFLIQVVASALASIALWLLQVLKEWQGLQ